VGPGLPHPFTGVGLVLSGLGWVFGSRAYPTEFRSISYRTPWASPTWPCCYLMMTMMVIKISVYTPI
jgi:hypothetical protein